MQSIIDINFVKSIAVEAGKRALAMRATMRPELKADNSYVTDIDRETERFVRSRLEERYPHFAFLGEEFGRHGGDDVPLWAVDPIDGTTNLVFGIPCWGVSIGLLEAGIPTAGAFYMPVTDELFWGTRGGGGYCNDLSLKVIDRDHLHPEDTLGFTSAAIKQLDTSALEGRVRCLGSIAADIAYVARGTLCSLVGCHEGAYDMAAALCVAFEAGCVAHYLNGDALDLNQVLVDGKTLGPFIVAPPQTASLITSTLKPKR